MHDGEKKMAGVVVFLLHEHTGLNLYSQPHGLPQGPLLGQQTLRPYPHDARQKWLCYIAFHAQGCCLAFGHWDEMRIHGFPQLGAGIDGQPELQTAARGHLLHFRKSSGGQNEKPLVSLDFEPIANVRSAKHFGHNRRHRIPWLSTRPCGNIHDMGLSNSSLNADCDRISDLGLDRCWMLFEPRSGQLLLAIQHKSYLEHARLPGPLGKDDGWNPIHILEQ